MIDDKVGIWGNSECVQCGACCYEYYMYLYGKPCEYQNIENGKSFCMIHEESRPRICEIYFCGKIPHVSETTRQRETLRQIALELGTVPKNYCALKECGV